jgi:hypothetical protein
MQSATARRDQQAAQRRGAAGFGVADPALVQ